MLTSGPDSDSLMNTCKNTLLYFGKVKYILETCDLALTAPVKLIWQHKKRYIAFLLKSPTPVVWGVFRNGRLPGPGRL